MKKAAMLERQSNFELLRIFSMLMIIGHHFSVHGDFNPDVNTPILNILFIDLLRPIGKIGVNVFILISGYFLSSHSKLSVKKIAKFWGQVLLYSVIIYCLFVILNKEVWNTMHFIQSFFPLIRSDWWFASTYFIMLLMSPFINMILDIINKKQHICILIIGFVFWCFVPTFFGYTCGFNNVLWFVYLYFCAAFIRRNEKELELSFVKCFIFSFFMWIASVFTEFCFSKIDKVFQNYNLYDMNTLWVFLSSLLLFLGFKNLKIKKSRFINIISSATFGVYLIHDNHLVRTELWKSLFRNSTLQNSNWLIPYALFAIAVVFVITTMIDFVRINTAEKVFLSVVEKAEKKIQAIFDIFLSATIKIMRACRSELKKSKK